MVIDSPHLLWVIIPLFFICFIWPSFYKHDYRILPTLSLSLSYVSLEATWWQRNRDRVIFFLSCLFLLISLSRPKIEDTNFRNLYGLNIIFILDISSSMDSMDVSPSSMASIPGTTQYRFTGTKRTPYSRLQEAKGLIKSIVHGRRSDHIGLILFSDYAWVEVPPTADHLFFLERLDHLTTEVNERRGLGGLTAIGEGLSDALKLLRWFGDEDQGGKSVILLTDGYENIEEDSAVNAARTLGQDGVYVHIIGVGGHGKAYKAISSTSGKATLYREVSYKARKNKHHMNASLLTKLTNESQGWHYRIYSEDDRIREIKSVNERLSSHRKLASSHLTDQYLELFPFFVGLSILFGVAYFVGAYW